MTFIKLPWRYLNRLTILTISLIVNSWATAELIPYQRNITAQKSVSIDQLKISFVKVSESGLRSTKERPEVEASKVQKKKLIAKAKAERPNKSQTPALVDKKSSFVKKEIEISNPDVPIENDIAQSEDNQAANKGSSVSHQLVNTSEESRNPLMSRPSFLTPPKSPRYPTIARKRGQEGTVWLEIWLNKFGEQTKRIITESSGVNALDSAALATVSQWAFMPHTQADVSIASRVKIPIEFVLN
jgi:protein TonB